jgi:hypothetical protein
MTEKAELERVFPEVVRLMTDDDGTVKWQMLARELHSRGVTTEKGTRWQKQTAEKWWTDYQGRLRERPEPEASEPPLTGSGEPEPEASEPPLTGSGEPEPEASEPPLTGSGEPEPEASEPPLTGSGDVIPASAYQLGPSGEVMTEREFREMIWKVWEVWKRGKFHEMLHEKTSTLLDSGKPLMPEIPLDSKKPKSYIKNPELEQMALEKANRDKEWPSGQKVGISGLIRWLMWRYIGSPEQWPPREQADTRNEPEGA